jgi:hypothetical protein
MVNWIESAARNGVVLGLSLEPNAGESRLYASPLTFPPPSVSGDRQRRRHLAAPRRGVRPVLMVSSVSGADVPPDRVPPPGRA